MTALWWLCYWRLIAVLSNNDPGDLTLKLSDEGEVTVAGEVLAV